MGLLSKVTEAQVEFGVRSESCTASAISGAHGSDASDPIDYRIIEVDYFGRFKTLSSARDILFMFL